MNILLCKLFSLIFTQCANIFQVFLSNEQTYSDAFEPLANKRIQIVHTISPAEHNEQTK
jgi:hypothetical protein